MIALRGGWYVMCWFLSDLIEIIKLSKKGVKIKKDWKYKSISKNFLPCRRFIPLSCQIQSICIGFDSQLSFPEINYVKRLCYRDGMKKMEEIAPEHDAERPKCPQSLQSVARIPSPSQELADKQLYTQVFSLAYSVLVPHFSKFFCLICGF